MSKCAAFCNCQKVTLDVQNLQFFLVSYGLTMSIAEGIHQSIKWLLILWILKFKYFIWDRYLVKNSFWTKYVWQNFQTFCPLFTVIWAWNLWIQSIYLQSQNLSWQNFGAKENSHYQGKTVCLLLRHQYIFLNICYYQRKVWILVIR